MRTLSKIVNKVDCKYGAPMGRGSNLPEEKPADKKVFDSAVPMNGAYDKGGAYWGLAMNPVGNQLRVEYTKDLSYVRFYRGVKPN